MMTTIDHISGGRAILGIGAAWFETEHEGFGIPFGDGPPERLRWLGQALPIMRGMLDGTEPSVTEGLYRTHAVRNDPAPVQRHLPMLIGGGGRKVTLKLVAKYADACNLGGSFSALSEAEAMLLEHCETVGRDEREIERTFGIGVPIIHDSREEARRVHADIFERHGKARLWEDQPVGTPEDLVEKLAPFVELGYHHVICGFPAPFDEETMTRLNTEVRPRLEAIARA
jgi:alkanesulfonate monooxygenase SsuD/methylene tetrahydromethanopterin reductase-like flavin-dependent oxidoreductase (luciferase family)